MPSRDGPAVIEVHDLVKRYPGSDTNAVDGLSFRVEPGEVFGLFGPNGAGKSTTIGVLTTRLRATAGRAYVGGVDVDRDPATARAQLAVVPQHNNLDRALTPRQNLVHHGTYHGLSRRAAAERADELLAGFGLTDRADRRIEAYSGGLAQRLMIARALVHEPMVLFLDEPTNALDPQTRLLIWGQLRRLRERGVAILLTTHAMNEAARVVDRVGIVDQGRLLTLDTPQNLLRSLAGDAILDLTVTPAAADGPAQLEAALGRLDGVRKVERLGPPAGPGGPGPLGGRPGANLPPAVRARLAAAGGAGALATLARQRATDPADGSGRTRLRLHVAGDPSALLGTAVTVVTGRSATVDAVQVSEPSLEDVFVELTGREPR
ncbi:ABC transporter ATP-binding protein [Micromonospora sp. SH-82]|uniref:ABC transporter ATP-binding protein n=1 Tax=Micromonospora sp. SH-82 TaxID=3132938 RepID=UPI003EBA3D33